MENKNEPCTTKSSTQKVDEEAHADRKDDGPMFLDTHEHSEIKERSSSNFDDDLFVSVTDPEKIVLTMDTYVSYKVSTKTTRSTFDESQFVVQRRYTDFVWLNENLTEEYPTYIIPPLPSKFILKGVLDRFSWEFMETRCRALNKFLCRLSKHPVLSFSKHLNSFLTAQNFSGHRKQGILSLMKESLKWSEVDHPEFQAIYEKASLFREKMDVLDRIGERLLEDKKELPNNLADFSSAFAEWGSREDDALQPVMTSMSECLEVCAKEAGRNADNHEKEFLPTFKEYSLYADVVMQSLKRRDVFQFQFEKSTEELHKKKEEKENFPKSDQSYSIGALLGKPSEQVREQKEEKLCQQIKELSKHSDKLNDELEKANSNFRADMDRWRVIRAKDMATLFSNHADAQLSYHERCLSRWQKALPIMQSTD